MRSIDALKSRISSNYTLLIQNEGGFISEMGFDWREPATDNEIQDFEATNKVILPMSYKKFLKISDGALLFEDIQYGQWGCKILGLSELNDISSQVVSWGYNLKQDWLVFGTWLGDCDILVFDLGKSEYDSNHYILDGEQGERVEDWIYIKGDFEKWIDRLIVAQGSKYWRWY